MFSAAEAATAAEAAFLADAERDAASATAHLLLRLPLRKLPP